MHGAQRCRLKPLTLQALDVVLKHRVAYNKDCLPVGRGFFFHDKNVGWQGQGDNTVLRQVQAAFADVGRQRAGSAPNESLGLNVGILVPARRAHWLRVVHSACSNLEWYYGSWQVRSIGGGAEVWLGYQQSLRPCQVGGARGPPRRTSLPTRVRVVALGSRGQQDWPDEAIQHGVASSCPTPSGAVASRGTPPTRLLCPTLPTCRPGWH